MSDTDAETPAKSRLIAITIDPKSVGRPNANVEHEREVAIFDILDGNSFALEGQDDGPYKLVIGTVDDRLVFTGGKKIKSLDALVGKPVEIRGKVVDTELEGQQLHELWPAQVRPK